MILPIKQTRHLRVGVPPGVGDTYWALTKLEALRARAGAKTVALYVQKTSLTRALDWAKVAPQLATTSTERPFRPDRQCLEVGYSNRYGGLHCVLWPNGPLDRGAMLADWLPELGPPDLAFAVRTERPARDPAAVVYASSDGVNNAWCANLGPDYWASLIHELAQLTGRPVTLIGKEWDASFRSKIGGAYVDLIGKTSLAQVFGVIERARVLVGVISGMTIMGNHFRTPTVAVRPVVPLNPRAWVAPEAPYIPVDAPAVPSPSGLAALAASIMR